MLFAILHAVNIAVNHVHLFSSSDSLLTRHCDFLSILSIGLELGGNLAVF